MVTKRNNAKLKAVGGLVHSYIIKPALASKFFISGTTIGSRVKMKTITQFYSLLKPFQTSKLKHKKYMAAYVAKNVYFDNQGNQNIMRKKKLSIDSYFELIKNESFVENLTFWKAELWIDYLSYRRIFARRSADYILKWIYYSESNFKI